MGNTIRQSTIVTQGNHAFPAAGEDVFVTSPGSKYGPKTNILAGQPVVYDPKTNKTLDAAGIASAKSVVLGVGIDTNNDGLADEIRTLGSNTDLCSGAIRAATAESPSCGVTQIVDVFGDVKECSESIGISVFLDDFVIRSWYQFNEKAQYPFTATAACDNCEECDQAENNEAIWQQLANAINNKTQLDPTMITYFQHADLGDQYQPFRAVYLRSNVHTFCLTPKASQSEIRTLTLSGGTDGARTVTVTLDGTDYEDIDITDGDDLTASATEIAAESYTGWEASSSGAVVTFVKTTPGASAGAFTLDDTTGSGTDITGTFALLEEAAEGVECGGCDYFDGITDMVIDSTGGNESTVDFTNTTLPNDSSKSVRAHLWRVADQINDAFDADANFDGEAVVVTGLGSCCDYCLQVITDDPNFKLTIDGTLTNPTNTETPLTPDDKNYGVRIYVDPLEVDCLCGLPTNKPLPNYLGRTVEVHQLGDWECKDFQTEVIQKQELPRGYGFFWQNIERFDSVGGRGRNHRLSNHYHGRYFPYPDENSRDRNITAVCKESYCTYALLTETTARSGSIDYNYNHNLLKNYILVPSDDSVTRASFETILDAIIARSDCGLESVSCNDGDDGYNANIV